MFQSNRCHGGQSIDGLWGDQQLYADLSCRSCADSGQTTQLIILLAKKTLASEQAHFFFWCCSLISLFFKSSKHQSLVSKSKRITVFSDVIDDECVPVRGVRQQPDQD